MERKRKSTKKETKSQVVSFRLSGQQSDLLTEIFGKDSPAYVKSEKTLARKIVCDFLAGRLVYSNPEDRLLDIDAHAASEVR